MYLLAIVVDDDDPAVLYYFASNNSITFFISNEKTLVGSSLTLLFPGQIVNDYGSAPQDNLGSAVQVVLAL